MIHNFSTREIRDGSSIFPMYIAKAILHLEKSSPRRALNFFLEHRVLAFLLGVYSSGQCIIRGDLLVVHVAKTTDREFGCSPGGGLKGVG